MFEALGPLVLVFYCYMTNYHKISGLMQCPLISSQFCRPEVHHTMAGFCAQGACKVEIKMSARLNSHLQAPGKKYPLPISFSLLTIQFLMIVCPCFLDGRQLLVAFCSLCYVVPSIFKSAMGCQIICML